VEDLTEKEQLDALRAWWAENGSYVIGGVVVGMLIIFGWNRWQATIENTEVAASSLFEDVMDAAGRGNLDAAEEPANELFISYNDSPYAAQARLAMARLYMDNGRDQDAADVLRGVIDADPNGELTLIARLRLAKILLYQGKAQEVVDLISDLPESAFAARFSELLGDAYVELEDYEAAEAAYIAALDDNPQTPTVDVSLLQLKINDLPADPGDTAASPETEATEVTAPGEVAEPGEDAEPTDMADDPATTGTAEAEEAPEAEER
jgi:predicted negative regulator of RcsB-dependent stress response